MGRRNKKGRRIHGVLLLDKETGCSSNQALQRVKWLYDANRAGHTGSLDPLATGMLPVCFGEATRLSSWLLDADKEYIATAQLGVTTDSGDADGQMLASNTVPESLDHESLVAVANRFQGPIQQIPPMYSALKVNGERLYKLARRGESVERAARNVTISEIEVVSFDDSIAVFRVRCSKGTYIRTLVEDIGQAIGCGAHIRKLRRTGVASFRPEEMISEASLRHQCATGLPVAEGSPERDGFDQSLLDGHLLPVDVLVRHLQAVSVTEEMQGRFQRGQGFACSAYNSTMSTAEPLRVYCETRFLGLAMPVTEALSTQDVAKSVTQNVTQDGTQDGTQGVSRGASQGLGVDTIGPAQGHHARPVRVLNL